MSGDDVNNIRYVTGTMIGEWSRDKVSRYVLLTRGGEPVPWDLRIGREAPSALRAVAAAGEQQGRRAGPAGFGGAEGMVVVTSDGASVITLYPAQDLPIANAY